MSSIDPASVFRIGARFAASAASTSAASPPLSRIALTTRGASSIYGAEWASTGIPRCENMTLSLSSRDSHW
ncbi:hypothetical protein [Rhodosalinus halophilus]|uniref:hypothetical protein n=1 Tax=Rhodosalinus halophilus TaxID=2259333 RepID=UPI001F319CC4|nr:hypothetical protein [Rhodosalinus halophilus]